MYSWGLRRTETSKLDVADWGRNPQAPEFGRYGMLHVRFGKAKRGQPPRRRNVASTMGWAVDAVADYVENIRPRFDCEHHPALWVTERGGRVKPPEINARFVAYRDALKLPKVLSPHSFGTLTSRTKQKMVLTADLSRSRLGMSATARPRSTPMSATTS